MKQEQDDATFLSISKNRQQKKSIGIKTKNYFKSWKLRLRITLRKQNTCIKDNARKKKQKTRKIYSAHNWKEFQEEGTEKTGRAIIKYRDISQN